MNRRRTLGGGRHAMSLLNRPFSLAVLDELSCRPMSVNELVDEVPNLTPGVAYRYVRELAEKGAVQHRARPLAGRAMDLVLTDYGHSLPDLGLLHQQWFELSSYGWGEMTFESELGQLVIASRVEGWGPQILWELEEEPRTMGWLESHLGAISDAELWGFGSAAKIRHRVRMMERTGQIEVVDRGERPIRYRPTSWSYRGAGCLAYAIATELHHQPPNFTPPSVRAIAFGLVHAGHMIQAAEDVSGIIQVSIPVEQLEKPIEIHYEVVDGRMRSWSWGRAKNPDAIGYGPLMDWLAGLTGIAVKKPVVTGDTEFFSDVIAGVQQGLFAPDSNL